MKYRYKYKYIYKDKMQVDEVSRRLQANSITHFAGGVDKNKV